MKNTDVLKRSNLNASELIGKKCRRGNTITTIKLDTGYSIGTVDAFGCLYCNLSKSVVKDMKDLDSLQADSKKLNIILCNKGKGCFTE